MSGGQTGSELGRPGYLSDFTGKILRLYLNVPDRSQPFGYNPLKRVTPERRPLAGSGLLEVFEKLWPEAWGVRREHIFRNALLALLDQPQASLPDKRYCKEALRHIANRQVRAFWENEYEKYSDRMRADGIAPIQELLIYQGVATRPDTNHRHHALIRMQHKYRSWVQETGSEKMERYNPYRPYALAVFTDDFEGEAHKFFVLNTKGWKVPPSKAYYVESRTSTPHAHSKLARELMEESGVLGERNVEIVQNSLSKNSAKMVLFYTLVRGLQAAWPYVPEEEERQELLQYLSEFVAELNRVRPNEVALLSLERRQQARSETVADQAILWIAYLRLAAWLRGRKDVDWKDAIRALGEEYETEGYRGDLLSRGNPLWQRRGILARNDKGQYRVISNRNAQEQAFQTLREVVSHRIGVATDGDMAA